MPLRSPAAILFHCHTLSAKLATTEVLLLPRPFFAFACPGRFWSALLVCLVHLLHTSFVSGRPSLQHQRQGLPHHLRQPPPTPLHHPSRASGEVQSRSSILNARLTGVAPVRLVAGLLAVLLCAVSVASSRTVRHLAAAVEQLTGDLVHFLANNLFAYTHFITAVLVSLPRCKQLVNYLAPPIRSCERGTSLGLLA